MLPIENSLHGPVAETHDLLYEAPLSIVSEVTLPIVHCLLAKAPIQVVRGDGRSARTRSRSTSAASSCTRSASRCIPSATTADAAREVAESDDPTEAAIASAEAAARFGLHVIAPDVGDHAAFTRFVGIAPYTRIDRAPRWRTALSFVTDHAPGSLYHALGPFHRHGLNLVQLVSRPIPQSTFRYRFDMVLDGHPLDAELRDGARRDARVDARGADLRQLPGDGRPLMGDDAVREDLGRARRRRAAGRAGAALRRPPPRPRGDEPAGVRVAAARGPAGAAARPDDRDDGPQRADASRARSRDPLAKAQLDALAANCDEFGVPLNATGSGREGIVHVMGPELGLTQPGMTIVCGDSHTSTHGAFGALAFGIGTSEVEHVLATQTLPQSRPKTMLVRFDGELPFGVTAKDMVLGAIGRIGVAGGVGHAIEYAGPAIEALSMEGRMTICNMSIEAGARAGMIAPDETTFAYLRGPAGGAARSVPDAWRALRSDPDAEFDRVGRDRRRRARPAGHVGDEPGHGRAGRRRRPRPGRRSTTRPSARRSSARCATWRSSRARRSARSAIDRVFIGSCTNARIEDLRAAAAVVDGQRVAPTVRAMVVPGSATVKRQAEAEGLDRVFVEAGFEWRQAGCSMCLGMNPDILAPGERCASTSNRNFEGRQGAGGRTHLVSPAMAAAAALAGRFADVRELG